MSAAAASGGAVEDDGSAPQCRICFAGEEAGRLFAPCQCRGSIGKVHVGCLNAWRNLSANDQSYVACDQCGYRYNVERAAWASKLESPNLAIALSALLILLLVVVGGVASRLVSTPILAAGCRRAGAQLAAIPGRWGGDWRSVQRTRKWLKRLAKPRPSHEWRAWTSRADEMPDLLGVTGLYAAIAADYARIEAAAAELGGASPLHLEFAFYNAVRFLPPWWRAGGPAWLVSRAWLADALDVMVAGLVLVGFVAFGTHLVSKLRHDFRFNAEHLLVPVMTMFASHGTEVHRSQNPNSDNPKLQTPHPKPYTLNPTP